MLLRGGLPVPLGSEVLMMLLMDSIVWGNNCRGSGAALALKDLEVNCCM